MSRALTVRNAASPAFWRALCPELSIEGRRPGPTAKLGDVKALIRRLRFEGYVNVPGVINPRYVDRLRHCADRLHRRRIPPVFAFVYDEFWRVFRAVSIFLEAALGQGYRALPDFWAWYVVPADTAAGWPPHRDRSRVTVDPDNSPHSLSVWLPFSASTPLNGCIYVVPAHLDERFERRVFDQPDTAVVADLQTIRALPAPAGSLLAWNQALLHWGARASRQGTAPRCSATFEFQRGDRPPFNRPLLDPAMTPSFAERLGLIGKQILQYQHMYPLDEEVAAVARVLKERFLVVG